MPLNINSAEIEDINFRNNLPRIAKVRCGEENGHKEVVWERPRVDSLNVYGMGTAALIQDPQKMLDANNVLDVYGMGTSLVVDETDGPSYSNDILDVYGMGTSVVVQIAEVA